MPLLFVVSSMALSLFFSFFFEETHFGVCSDLDRAGGDFDFGRCGGGSFGLPNGIVYRSFAAANAYSIAGDDLYISKVELFIASMNPSSTPLAFDFFSSLLFFLLSLASGSVFRLVGAGDGLGGRDNLVVGVDFAEAVDFFPPGVDLALVGVGVDVDGVDPGVFLPADLGRIDFRCGCCCFGVINFDAENCGTWSAGTGASRLDGITNEPDPLTILDPLPPMKKPIELLSFPLLLLPFNEFDVIVEKLSRIVVAVATDASRLSPFDVSSFDRM
mmetsp:Transcript_56330/g.136609  ORF Transcript_56330/g.136609 Transcript_56330/m.136609 type:complete len:273 (+) Transcript_56330:4218-5036(+)